MKTSKIHRELENGRGKCSVPMWIGGFPAGFCDNEAYGFQMEQDIKLREIRRDYLYVPALACPVHGGPTKEKALNLCDYCDYCFAECKSNPKFGHGIGNDNVYECDTFESKI